LSDFAAGVSVFSDQGVGFKRSRRRFAPAYADETVFSCLDRLNDQEKLQFEDEVLSEIKIDYPIQTNGKVLFPFKRLFMIGYK